MIDLRARLYRANEIISEKKREMASVIKTKEETIKKLRDGLSVIEDDVMRCLPPWRTQSNLSTVLSPNFFCASLFITKITEPRVHLLST